MAVEIADKIDAFVGMIVERITGIQYTRNKKQYQIDQINKLATYGQVESFYNNMALEMQKDPDILATYNARLADASLIATRSKSQIERLIDAATAPFEPAGNALAQLYMNIPVTTPETALAAATKLVALDFAKDIGIGIAGLAAETGSAGQIDTLTHFHRFMKTKTGYMGPITMLMKSPIELGLIAPLSKQLHSQYRDKWLASQVAMNLATKGHLDDDHLRKAFQYEGYPDWAIDATLKDRYRELRLGELAWAMSDSAVSDEWLDEKLKAALYAPEDRPIIIGMLRERYLRTYRDKVASQLKNHYKEGYISAQGFRLKLASLNIPLGVRDMMVQEADLLYRFDLNADLLATWTLAYKNDIISENVLRGNLATIIADPARVEGQVNKATAARKPVKVAEPKEPTQGIRIASKPSWSSIILDDRDTGLLTPDTVTTSAGRHTLVIRAEGFEDAAYDLDVPEATYMEVHAELVGIGETI